MNNNVELYEKVLEALTLKTSERFAIRKVIANLVGDFANFDGRFYIKSRYHTETSMQPSRDWSFSQYNHIITNKYLKSLKIKLEEQDGMLEIFEKKQIMNTLIQLKRKEVKVL